MAEVSDTETRIRLWGVRGSIPVPGPATLRYGGNTTCVEIRADGEIIVLDAGSGIRALGQQLQKDFGPRPIKLSLLLTHAHWDHIQGLPFFLPAYKPSSEIRVFGYGGAQTGLKEILSGQMSMPFFPVRLKDLKGRIEIEELNQMEFSIGRIRVQSKFLNHPGVCAGYRLFTSSGSVAFLPDNEPYERHLLQVAEEENLDRNEAIKNAASERAALVEFLRDADALILDAQYTDEEYETHIGWGHSSLSAAVSHALDANVRKLLLFHHDPDHDDDMVDSMVSRAREIVAESGKKLEVIAASEGDEIFLNKG